MLLFTRLLRLTLALLFVGSLGACTVVPLGPPAVRIDAPPVYIETYPSYRYYGQPYYRPYYRRY